jgi:hypothetical protein
MQNSETNYGLEEAGMAQLDDSIATICSSVKRALRIAPSESGATLSRNQWSEIPGAGQDCLDVLSRQMDQGQRRPVTICAMRSHFVVLCTPFFNLFAGVLQIQEPMPAEALEPNRGIEAFHVGIVGRLAWAAEVQRDAVRVGFRFRKVRFVHIDGVIRRGWMGDNVSEPLDGARAGRIVPERNVSPYFIVIGGVFRKDSPKVFRVEHDQMIRTFAPDRADQAFYISVLPRRAERRGPVPGTHCLDPGLKGNAECSIIVANEIVRCAVPRKCFGDLARQPLGRRIAGHRKPQQAPTFVAQLLEQQTDRSRQSLPYDCAGRSARSARSAMADPAGAPYRSKPSTGRPRCRA